MNYYDYRGYLNEIENDLENIYSRQADQQTQIAELKTDLDDRLQALSDSLDHGIIVISALLVMCCAIGVFFRS